MVSSSEVLEAWRPVVGFGGVYEVSDHGRVRSWARGDPKVMTQGVTKYGYRTVSMGGRVRRVHQLVLEAWGGPRPTPKAETRHLDGDPSNNRPSNLAWGTRHDNAADKTEHGTHNNTKVTHCRRRGHALTEPNLDPAHLREGKRACYSCRWASLTASNARVRGAAEPDRDALAAAMYAFLMEGGPDPRPATRSNTHAERVLALRGDKENR